MPVRRWRAAVVGTLALALAAPARPGTPARASASRALLVGTNGDLAADTSLHDPGNCFHGNQDAAGLTSDPPAIETVMGQPCGRPNGGEVAALTAELVCASEVFGTCPEAPGATYPHATKVTMAALPGGLPSMPDPCLGVPRNAWCPGA
ncbi:MAG TPA: hypothetical protein VKI64_03020 [Acidimicrobiales bacterium]|nr:hypothetical protein [Acidimicrobiales bacterium]